MHTEDEEQDIRRVFDTFRIDSSSRDYCIENTKHVSWNMLNNFLRQHIGHPISRWFLLLDLDFHKRLRISSANVESLRHEIQVTEIYISNEFGSTI